MADLHVLFLEYSRLDRRRTRDGLTTQEYDRWRLLSKELARRFTKGPPGGASERRDSVRVPTRLKVSFESRDEAIQALMTNLSRGGLFINTAFPAEPGTRFELELSLESSGERFEVPVEVVSNHVGGQFETGELGMGVRFLPVPPELRRKIDALYEELGRAAREAEAAEPGPDAKQASA